MTAGKKDEKTEAVEFALLGDDISELLAENFNGELDFALSDLPAVTWPGAGDDRFFVKSAVGEQRATEIVGVVLGQRTRRAFYLNPYIAGSSDPPDCSSEDGETGEVATGAGNYFTAVDGETTITFGGSCEACPLNAWESGRLTDAKYTGAGKACAEQRQLLVLPPDKVRPMLMRLPSTALRAWKSVAWELTDRRIGLSRALLRFTLAGKAGETAALKVEVANEIPADQSALLKGLMPSFKQAQLAAAPDVAALPVEDAEPF